MINLTDTIYSDPNAAREHLEALHWPYGPVCPRCGTLDRITKLAGKSTRPGVYKCNECAKPFTVTVGTIFEDSKIPLNKWLMAFALLNGSKKGFSAHQLSRSLGITYKSAWFMAHRIREAMRSDDTTPFGGPDSTVEIDETFIGRVKGAPKKRAFHHKMKVLALVDRSTGRSRAMVVANVNPSTIIPIVRENVLRETHIMTDEGNAYRAQLRDFGGHSVVAHGVGEYVRGDVHTNTIEGYFSIFKRGMKGIYQHCGEKHLHRYLAEFDFRYTNRAANGFNDTERTAEALKGARGKRLTYRQPAGYAA